MGLPQQQIDGLRIAGLIHDLGKVTIPAEILSKPGKLTETEFSIIKNHPQVAYDILRKIDFPWPVADIVLQHHEYLNGSGYPQGLKEKDILFEARILTVADIVEAMASHRPYRPALGIDRALDEVKFGKGTRFDATVVDACLAIFAKAFKLD
jgi:HD-GYP domain-containing protein (c-di-GMP phosphodiesterase class II)